MPADIIYMDHQATTPCDPDVVAEMLPWFADRFGNAASRTHAFGWEAEEAVEAARKTVSNAVGGATVAFTSGATESNNLALAGLLGAEKRRSGKRFRIVTQATEHKAVLDCVRYLEREGAEGVVLPVDATGRVDPDHVERELDDRTLCVSIMAANNEIGTVQPLSEIGSICAESGVPLHVDAAQGVGRIPLDLPSLGVDLLSLSAHKIYGPKGVGALVCRRGGARPHAIVHGGGHEDGLRSGTLNVPGIVGLARAVQIAMERIEDDGLHLSRLSHDLWRGLKAAVPDAMLNGPEASRLPGNLSVSFPGVEGEALIMSLKDTVALSSGSACTSATVEPSHVLRAIGRSTDLSLAALRFGLGRGTTDDHIARVLESVPREVLRLRKLR